MGRCYEFCVAIADGCDHAMVVSDEGGHCVCPTCEVRCEGRFRACGPLLAQPGYVPVTAPQSMRPGAAPAALGAPRRAPDQEAWNRAVEPLPGRDRQPLAPAVVADNAPSPQSLLEELLARPDRAADAINMLNHGLATRDEELSSTFERLAEAHRRLVDEIAADRESRQALVAAVERLAARIEALEEKSRQRFNLGRVFRD